ncbi:MAG: beta-ketoacyl-[acyl-carrier-protein] synthase family protein [Deltaproteobacteria bacterium]|nr:beta-ketoacyl-[acyl-carrier-protein] synthase family protein [Deltaproteobacteria bacterium]
MTRRVVVTGMGIITALGSGKAENLSGIIAGASAIGRLTSFDASGYRGATGAEIRGFEFDKALSPNSPKRYDRAAKLLLTVAREAIREAGFADKLPADTPVVLGTTLGGMLSGSAFHKEIVLGREGRASSLFDYIAFSQGVRVAEDNGASSNVFSISNACASGTNAIGFALNEIRGGISDIALAGGYDTMCEFTVAGFNSLQAITTTLCRPFDLRRDGLVLGEGAAILILEEMGAAKRRGTTILAEIAGYGESSDAYHITRPDPTAGGARLAIKRALEDAACAPSDVDYINAHGTATSFNDAMEAKAIREVFKDHAKTVPVSSIKSAVGHILGGAGAIEAVISIVAMNESILPSNINYSTPDPECPLNIVDRPGQKHNIKRVLSNSFGFGGANAALVIQKYRDREP